MKCVELNQLVDDATPPSIEGETDIHKALSGGVGIPNVLWAGMREYSIIVAMDPVGPTLRTQCRSLGGKLSLKTVLLLADQLISRLEYIHSKGYILTDMRPSKFAMGVGCQENVVQVIDFSGAIRFNGKAPKVKGIAPRFLDFYPLRRHEDEGKRPLAQMNPGVCMYFAD